MSFKYLFWAFFAFIAQWQWRDRQEMGEKGRGMTCHKGCQTEPNRRQLQPCGHVAWLVTIQLPRCSGGVLFKVWSEEQVHNWQAKMWWEDWQQHHLCSPVTILRPSCKSLHQAITWILRCVYNWIGHAYTSITMNFSMLWVSVGILMGKHNVEINLTDDTTTYSLCFSPGIFITTQFPTH